MFTNVTINGVVYKIPAQGAVYDGWATDIHDVLVALSEHGGGDTLSLPLSADADFGLVAGLIVKSIQSHGAVPSTGTVRLNSGGSVSWLDSGGNTHVLDIDTEGNLLFDEKELSFNDDLLKAEDRLSALEFAVKNKGESFSLPRNLNRQESSAGVWWGFDGSNHVLVINAVGNQEILDELALVAAGDTASIHFFGKDTPSLFVTSISGSGNTYTLRMSETACLLYTSPSPRD